MKIHDCLWDEDGTRSADQPRSWLRVLALILIFAGFVLAGVCAARGAEVNFDSSAVVITQGSGMRAMPALVGNLQVTKVTTANASAGGNFLIFPQPEEKISLFADFGSSEAVTSPITVRLAGKKVGKIQPAYATFDEGIAPGGFFGRASGPQVIFGRQPAVMSGKFPDGTPFRVSMTVMVPLLDAIAACDLDGANVLLTYRLRGYRPESPAPQVEYEFTSDRFSGHLQFLYLQGLALPAPVWTGVEVDNTTYDTHFVGVHQFRFKVDGVGRSPDNVYTVFWERQYIDRCKG